MTETAETESFLAACRRDDRGFLPSSAQRDAAHAAQPWTATRCHRLLRPLLSHLAALRKVEARLAAKTVPETEPPKANPGRKRVRYTYSLKGIPKRRPSDTDKRTASSSVAVDTCSKHQHQQAGRYVSPGEVVVPTPVLHRATKRKRALSVPSSPIERHTATRAVEARGKPVRKDEWAGLRMATPSECHQPYECIFRAVEALLRATSTSTSTSTRTSTSARGSQPRSLLAMCLRKVPQYTAAYEAQEAEEARRRGDMPPAASHVSFSVYTDLESWGHGATGWPHLRTVVRAHAIDLVAAACADGLLRPAFVRLLVRFLARTAAYDEAERLLCAAQRSPIPAPTDVDSVFSETDARLYALRLLVDYAEATGRWSCLLEQLAARLAASQLPCAWLSTRALRGVWQEVVRVSSSRTAGSGVRRASLAFATAAVTQLCAQPAAGPRSGDRDLSWKAYPTLVSVVGSLAAVAILQREADDASPAPSQRQLAMLVEACLADEPTRPEPTRPATRLILRLAQFLAGGDRGDGLADVQAAGADQHRPLYDAAMTLIVSVAQSCGRGAAATPGAKPARVYLAELCRQAADVLAGEAEARDDQVQRMLTDGAFLLASRTNDLRDLAFAESLGTGRVSRRLPASASASTSASPAVGKASSGPTTPTALFAGYRWEEGISEWVIANASPVGRQLWKRRTPVDSDSDSDGVSEGSGEDSDLDELQSTTPVAKRRHGRHSWPSQEGRDRQAKRTILSLVSDGEDETGDEEESYDEISLETHLAAPRRERDRRRRRRTAPPTILRALDEGSDDELCL